MTSGSPFIKIPDDFSGYQLDQLCVEKHYIDVLEKVLIPNGFIMDRVEKLALDIASNEDFIKDGLIAFCVLKGGFKFFADLLKAIDNNNRNKHKSIPVTIEFIKVKSYENDYSTGNVKISGYDNFESIVGKNVLIVEDIIDTGRTMKRLLEYLKQFKPASIKVVSLLLKRTPTNTDYCPDYVGFEVPNKFIVGYACDYNDYFRDLSHICLINDVGIARYRK